MVPGLSVDTYAPAFDLGVVVEARAVSQVVQSIADGWVEATGWCAWRVDDKQYVV